MLNNLELQSLEERRKQLRLSLFFKVVKGLVPALPADKFLKEIKDKRQIKPKIQEDFISDNLVRRQDRNHKQCFHVETTSTDAYENSFFIRTVIDWNNLDSKIVEAKTVGTFKAHLSKRA